MNISKRQLAELIGVGSVVASLIFVGIQLYFDRRVALGSQYHERVVMGQDFYLSKTENDAWVKSTAKEWTDGHLPPWWNPGIDKFREERGLTMEDMVREEGLARTSMIRFSNNYYQYALGLLAEDYPATLRRVLETRMSERPMFRAVALSSGPVDGYVFQLAQEIDATLNLEE